MLPGMQVRHTLQLNSFFALLLILPFLYTATTTIPSPQATTSSPQATSPSPRATSLSPQATNQSPPASSKGGLSPGVIAGIVTGVIIGVVLAAFFICWPWRRSRVAAATQSDESGPSSLPEMCQPQPEERRAGDSQPLNRPELGDSRRPSELDSEPPELSSEPPHHDPMSPTQGLHPVNESVDSFHSARGEVGRDFPRRQTDLHDRIV